MQYLFSQSHEDGMSGRRCIRGAFRPYSSVRLDYILESWYRLSLSLLHPFLRREGSRPFPTKTRDLAVYFVASPSTRRPSSCFLDPPSGRALPSPSTKGTTEPSSSALSVFLSSSPRPPRPPLLLRSGLPVHRCHPSPSSPATSFARVLSLAPPARRFFSVLALGV